MTPEYSQSGIAEFIKGIEVRNPVLVKEAIGAGVRPDTSINGRHPLWILVHGSYDNLPSALQTGMTREEFSRRTSQIVDELFDNGVKVAEEEKYRSRTQAYLADRFLMLEDVKDAATVVLHAIHETLADNRPVYKPDLAGLVAGLFASGAVPETANYRLLIEGIVARTSQLHDAVRERLQNPQGDIEKEIAARGDVVQYWMQPLERPDVGKMMIELGLAPRGAPDRDLREKFDAEAQPQPDFVMEIPKKSPGQVLKEMSAELVGLDELKSDAKRLVFRQSYDNARKAENLDTVETSVPGTAYMGHDGVGKSSFAHKRAELLVALGLAGPNLVEITHDSLGKMAGSYDHDSMREFFRRADIIHIEFSGGARDREGKSIDDYVLNSVQAALDGRKAAPVLLLSGRREDIEAALESAPGIKALIGSFVTVAEPSFAQLGQALERRLAGPNPDRPNFVIDADAKALVLDEFAAARKRLGSQCFRNMREVDAVAAKLPDAMAERLFGAEENEQALAAAPNRESLLKTVTVADVRALNLRSLLGGPALMKKPSIGFHASL